LYKSGVRLKLAEQPFRILEALLESPGMIVTRDDLKSRLWPDGVFVDFDRSLNKSIVRLREALGDSADSPRYIETLPRQGYRFLAEVSCIEASGNAAAPFTPLPDQTLPTIATRRRYPWVIGVAIIAILLLSGTAVVRKISSSAPIDSVAVLPLTNASNDPNLEYLSEGITESIISDLSRIPSLRVISRDAAFRYKGRTVDAEKVARELGVGAVLLGTVEKRGNNLFISVELVQANGKRQLWGKQYELDVNSQSALAAQKEISLLTSENLRLYLTGEQRTRIARHQTGNAQAYDLYLRGKYSLDRRTPATAKEALGYFQKAAEMDPSYALPYHGISASYGILNAYSAIPPAEGQRAEEAAILRELDVNPDAGESHLGLGMLLLHFHHDPAGAEREWRKAIELNSNLADAHHALSMLLSDAGKFEEALREARHAEELDPFSMPMRSGVIGALTHLKRFDEAIAKATGYDGSPLFDQLGLVHAAQGDYRKAAAELERIQPEKAGFLRHALAYAYARIGRTREARAILEEMLRKRQSERISPYRIAVIYAGLNDKDNVIRWLKTAAQEHDPPLRHFDSDGRFQPYRNLLELAAVEEAAGFY
jgi:TolB-like protein/DNA-binding winged helix-turn-helix (wHTH) protein/Flp pilus assembly protein TadD